MSSEDQEEITRLLIAQQDGDENAFDRLMPLVYHQLKRLARSQLGGRRGSATLDTTALVHEAYLKLVRQDRVPWENRGQFFGIAARAMRQIIVDYAREKSSLKRGGDAVRVPLEGAALGVADDARNMVELDKALERLASRDERLVRVVECRFFGGLTESETADALGVSVRTIQRDWTKARAWLAMGA